MYEERHSKISKELFRTIRLDSLCARGALIALDASLLIHQATYYQYYELPANLDVVFLVPAFLFTLFSIAFSIPSPGKMSSSQIVAAILTIYVLVSGIVHGDSLSALYLASIDFIILVFCFSLFKRLRREDEKGVMRLQQLTFAISVILYFAAKLNFSFYTSGEHSSIMYPFMLLPFMLAANNKWIGRGALVVMAIIALFEASRTTFVLTIVFLVFELIWSYDKKNSEKSVVTILLISLIFLVAVIWFYQVAQQYSSTNIIEKTQQYGDSFRLDIYSEVLSVALHRDLFSQLFGSGFLTTVSANSRGYAAHNDFIESYFDYGIVGLVLLVLLVANVALNMKGKLGNSMVSVASVVVVVLLCFTNMVFYNYGPVSYMMMFWAYVITREPRKAIEVT